jgi:hypothetical protein
LTDTAVVAVLAPIAVAITIATQALRAMYYDGKLEKLQDKMQSWLNEVDDELGNQLKSNPIKERVIEIVAKFSAIKSMQQRVKDIQDENASSIKNTVAVYAFVIVAAVMNLNLFTIDSNIVFFFTALGILSWSWSLYSVYGFMNEYNNLEVKHKEKKT